MACMLNIKCWGPKDRSGQVIKRADTIIVYRPNGSTDTIWQNAYVSNMQTNPKMVCVLCGDGNYHYFAPENIYVVESSAPVGTKVEKLKQEANYRLLWRRDNVYHPGLGGVIRDRQGNVIHFSDKVIVYMPNRSTEILWEEAYVSSAQEGDGTVCVVYGDDQDYYCWPTDLIVTRSKDGAKQLKYVCTDTDASTGTEDKINTKRKTSKKPKQWENYRLPRRRDNVYHPGLGEVVYVDKRVNNDVVLRRINASGSLMREQLEADVSEVYPIQRCYYKDGRWRPIK